MIKIVKLLYYLSTLLFLVVLLYVYASLPERVGVYFDTRGVADITKAEFFYLALGLFVFTNGLIFLYRRVNGSDLSSGKSNFDGMTLSEITCHWMHGLSFVFNAIYIFSISFIGLYHNADHFDITNYIALVYTGPIMLLAWVCWFVYLQLTLARR